MSVVEELRQDLATGNVVLVIGTGVSVAATKDPRAAWPGFIRSGIRYAESHYRLDPDLKELCLEMLQDGSPENLLSVAAEIVSTIGGVRENGFADWLRREIGSLDISDETVPRAVLNLGYPILTTNYDSVLESVGGLDGTTWRQRGGLQQVVAGTLRAIGHFHGHYLDADSVILTGDQYRGHLLNQHVTTLRNSMAAATTLVFIGCGDGLDDPSFTSVRDWLSESLPGQGLRQYRLCRESELEALVAKHAGTPVTPVPYGATYEDLAPFLDQLPRRRASAVSSIGAPEIFRQLENGVRDRSIIAPYVPNRRSVGFEKLLIPPVILPVPHEQYARAAERGNALDRPQRCELDEILSLKRLLLAGDPNTGVTSALEWLVLKHHKLNPQLVPMVLNFREMTESRRNLDSAIRRQLRFDGFQISDSDALPPLSLAIDNFTIGSRHAERTVAALEQVDVDRLVVGCETSSAAEIHASLAVAAPSLVVRHVGKMWRSDVRHLAGLADHHEAKAMSERAIEVAKSQHLPSTPFTFAMIISVLLSGRTLESTVSNTGLLDRYVNELMQWGEEEDHRFQIDAENRSRILEYLAEVFVEQRAGSLPQDQVIATLQKRFEQLEWGENPLATLVDLQDRRLIITRGTEVVFSQSSYLHLFAAKRAKRRDANNFLAGMKERALFFAPILKHYAALQRDDSDLVDDISRLLEGLTERTGERNGILGRDDRPPTSEARVLESLDRELTSRPDDEEIEDSLDPLLDDGDVEPFPLKNIDELNAIARLALVLDLVSTVLRDTDHMTDPTLRRSVLTDLLRGWANLVTELEADDDFKEMANEAFDELVKTFNVSDVKVAEARRYFAGGFALALVFGGLNSTLSSKKLAVSLNTVMDESGVFDDAGAAVVGTALALDLKAPNWSRRLLRLEERYGDVKAVNTVMKGLAQKALVTSGLSEQEETDLIEFLIKMAMRDLDRPERKGDFAVFEQRVRKTLLARKMLEHNRPEASSILSDPSLDQE